MRGASGFTGGIPLTPFFKGGTGGADSGALAPGEGRLLEIDDLGVAAVDGVLGEVVAAGGGRRGDP